MNPEDIKKQAVNRGRDAIASLRRDFTPRDFNALPPVPGQIPSAPEPVRRVLPQNKPLTPTQFAVSALKPITQPIAKTVDEAFIKPGVVTAQRIGQVISELKPKAENIKRIEAKYNPLNAKSVPRAALSLLQKGKDPKAVALSVAQTASKDLQDYVSDYVSGTLTSLDAPNRIVIRPAWDTYKIKLAQDRNQDVDVAGVLQGSKTLSLPDILQIDPNSLDYQAYRFLDFAPELINVPGGGTGKTVSLAKNVKLPQEGLFDEIAQDAAQKFARETGEALSKEVVDRAKEIVKDKSLTLTGKKPDKLIPRKEITPAEIAVQGELGGVPPSGNIPLALPGGVPFQTKQRKFPTTVKEAKSTAKGVTKILEDRFDLYSPIKNATEYEKAVKFVNENTVDDVIEGLKYTDDPVSISYVGQALMSKLQKEGNFQRVIDVLDIVAEQGTRSGQAVQALSIWGKLTPEGALKTARSRVAKYNTDNKLTPDMPGYLKLTESQAKRISEQAMKMLKAPEGYDRMKEASNLVAEIAKTTPASIGDKIAAFQTIAQLLNPKTFIRNIGGNLLFGSIDVLSQNFASLIDLATALFTKKRTIAPANLKKLTEGGVEGLQKGLQEALTGADTTNLKSQFDLPNASVFDSRIMQGLEKALGVVLKAPDRAFYEATYKDTLSGLMKLNKTNKPTKEMIEIAHAEGLRRTFQDDTRASKAFQMIKNAFNKAGIKGFGLGDLVLKYPKTPANLLVRATEYSPVGFLTTVYELARPLFGQPFRQREFANNLSRALVGSGIITTGANLYNLGILTPRPNSDKDLRSAQDLQGLKSYSFNISALKRFVMSGFDADAAKPAVGDTLYSYDWAQPISVPLAMGANIAENQNKVKTGSFADKLLLSFGPLGSEIIQSADTLVEQPLLTGLQRLFTSQNPTQGIVDTITSLPASFVPTLFNQINQLTDNVSRETYSPDYFQAAINQTQARIPYLATFLPERKDILGRTRYKYPDNSNTIFNVFINPGFMDTIKENESLKEVISIFEETGEKGQIPRVVQKSIKVNGEDRLLSGPEISNYQQELGQLSDNVIRSSLLSENYLKLSPTDRSKLIATMITDANKVAKIRLFGETADDISQTQELLLNGDINRYVDDRVAKKEEALIRQKFRQSGIKISGIKSPVAKKPRIRKAPKVKKARIPKIKKRKPIKISGIRVKRRKPRNI